MQWRNQHVKVEGPLFVLVSRGKKIEEAPFRLSKVWGQDFYIEYLKPLFVVPLAISATCMGNIMGNLRGDLQKGCELFKLGKLTFKITI